MRQTRSMMGRTLAALPTALVAVALVAAEAGAQQRTRRPVRRQQPIEIRGQVPTPQVVTVRPREVPQYNRRFLVPNFYDHDFWPAILPGYQLVSRRLVTGNGRLDSLMTAGADSARMADSVRMAAQGRAAIGVGLLTRPMLRPATGADSTRRMMAPGDSTMRRPPTPGTPGDTTRRVPPAGAGDTIRRPPADTSSPSGGTPPATGRR